MNAYGRRELRSDYEDETSRELLDGRRWHIYHDEDKSTGIARHLVRMQAELLVAGRAIGELE